MSEFAKMDATEILEAFGPLLIDLNDVYILEQERPLLAHYTSMAVLEKILKTEEVWFSNPLFMNDLEEVRFGFRRGREIFKQSETIRVACDTADRYNALKHYFYHYFNEFDQKQALDVYVFCLSQHERENEDGRLSMWRGYGGQGNGAALVFNTRFFGANPNSPLLIAKVRYGSGAQRLADLNARVDQWCQILRQAMLPDDKLYLAAFAFFLLIKFFALVTKHIGFKEEWRVIYMPEYDRLKLFEESRDYVITARGVEPKLKFKIAPLPMAPAGQPWTFSDILEAIVLGPSVSSPLAKMAVLRMLETMHKVEFQKKVVSSSIPLRPT